MLRRKKIVLKIMRCEECDLIFRWPMETLEEADAYYQDQYTPEYPQVRLPDASELRNLLATNFVGSPLDLNDKIGVLKMLRPHARVLDYGCSWGYGVVQLRHHGLDAVGFEISKPRARYARERLCATVFETPDQIRALPDASFDVIFTNHVIEHLPIIRNMFEQTSRLLAPDGLAFHVLPNFTGKLAKEGMWIMWIGEEHPLAPTISFFQRNLPKHSFTRVDFGSSPFNRDLGASLGARDNVAISTEGDELLVLAYK